MGENDIKDMDEKKDTIDEIMRERSRLDQIIQTKYRKKMTILFSDICGFTSYMEKRGDISGRAWVQQHHDIVLPVIEQNDGKILNIMGDGILAAFSSTLSAAKASTAIQRALEEYNKSAASADEIHVSIGINTGEILADEANIAGDVVNVASRIETIADRDQILVSKSTYEEICGSEDILCRAFGKFNVKGKAEPLELYRVVWQDEDIVLSTDPRVRSAETAARRQARPLLKILQLEITREENSLKIGVSEQNAGEASTVRNYEEIPVPMEKIGERCRDITETLNNANRKGRLTRAVLMKLREFGQIFRDELFTASVRQKMEESKADHLIVYMDDQLVHIPWELLHDGKQFLCQRFNMGRLVKTRQTILNSKSRLLARPLKMLVLADPKGDLKEAHEEGRQICDFLNEKKSIVTASLRSAEISHDLVMEKIKNFDFVHFAGHAEYQHENPLAGGWRLSDGVLRAQDIFKIAGSVAMPALIFSNSCQSALTEEWGLKVNFQDDIFGLANAFIIAGVKHYIGTFWDILDEPSGLFALEFYQRLFSGVTIGEAMRMARLQLIEKFGEETIVWASYLLYGDPTFDYMSQIHEKDVEPEEIDAGPAPVELGKGTTRKYEGVPAKTGLRKISKIWWGAAAALILALLLWVYPGFIRTNAVKYEETAMASYRAGDYSGAKEISQKLLEKSPDRALGYLILGDISLREGNLEKAESLFKKALDSGRATGVQKAEALMGLGRLSSIGKDTSGALGYYQQAAKLEPETEQAYTSQAILLNQQGEYDRALILFKKAEALAPDNIGIRAMANETSRRASLAADRERQERIDKLVKEILKSPERPVPAAPSDGWTSLPLTIWLMDFETKGYSLEEGKERVIASGLIESIIEKSRAKVVERAILDKLMEELRLSTTELVDRHTALSIGRMMAARLILSGQVIHAGPETQIAMRIIETQTGEVKGAVNEVFGSAVPPSTMAEKLSGRILEKLAVLYPLRGKVSGLNGDQITLNIGQRQGVSMGQEFRVKDTDTILKVTGVDPDASTASSGKGAEGIELGMRVEAP